MEKYHGFDQQFYEWLFDKIVTDGGLRLQIIASDMGTSILTLVNQLQKQYDPKHPLNLFRKQYGNIYEALKAMKSKPFFDLDSMVIRMKKPEVVRTLGIKKDLMEKYEKKLISNEQEEIKIMKINHENLCTKCDKVYNVNVNGVCPKGGNHNGKY